MNEKRIILLKIELCRKFFQEFNFGAFEKFRKRVKAIQLRWANNRAWGDRLDSRFVALYYLKDIKNIRVLDLGCNIGLILNEFDQSNFKVGVDLHLPALTIARQLNDDSAKFLAGDILNVPLKNIQFDVIVLMGMLEIFHDPQDKVRCLTEILKVLPKGGRLIITTPNKRYLSRLNKEGYLDYNALKVLLEKDYDFEMFGFNPFPSFPYFLPNSIMERIPFIWRILFFMMRNNILIRYCRSFFVVAQKK